MSANSAKWDRINERVNGGRGSSNASFGYKFEVGKYGDFFMKPQYPPDAVHIGPSTFRGGQQNRRKVDKPKDKNHTEENFPFHRNEPDADAKSLFENICGKPCVEVKQNNGQLFSLILCKEAYELGDKLIYFYTEHALIHSRIRGKRSPLEHWLGRNRHGTPRPSDTVKARNDIWQRGEPSVFSAFSAKAVFDWFKPETVFDPCAGWGARAIGALAAKSVKCYVATDINEKLFETQLEGFGYSNLKKELDREDKLAFFNCSILDFDTAKSKPVVPNLSGKIPEQYDMIFTSPPFYDYEIYNSKHAFVKSGDDSSLAQSGSSEVKESGRPFKDDNAVYPTYDAWQKKFYLPFCEKLYGLLKPGGVTVLHVGSTWISPKLPEVTRALMESVGFVFDYEFYFESSKKVPVLVFHKK